MFPARARRTVSRRALAVICPDAIQRAYSRRNHEWDGSYKIDKNGVLRILPEDEGKPLIQLSPAYWLEINESRSDDIGTSVD
jgi:hypothetical protein